MNGSRLLFLLIAFCLSSLALGAQQTWQDAVRARLVRADALEARQVETTDALIDLAYQHEDASLVTDIANMFGAHAIVRPEWRKALVESSRLHTVLLEHLDLLLTPARSTQLCLPQWEVELCAQAVQMASVRTKNLVAFYRELAAAASAGQFLQLVPPGAKAKDEFVHLGIRSALDSFMRLKPTIEQVRKLALWTHDFDMQFSIEDRALRTINSASDFLLLTDYYYLPPSAAYRNRVRSFLMEHKQLFMSLNPSAAELNQFQTRTAGRDADLSLLDAAYKDSQSAAELLNILNTAFARAASNPSVITQLKGALAQRVERFAQLEPNVEQINRYRQLMLNGPADFALLRASAAKLTSAADFLSLVRLFGVTRERRLDAYSVSMRAFLIEHLELFLSFQPTIAQINQFREKLMDPAGDLVVLRATFKRLKSAAEMLELATFFGREPWLSTSDLDFVTTQAMVENLAHFLEMQPNLTLIGEYRARMANPDGDLKLVAYGLQNAVSVREALALVQRRPLLNNSNFDQQWSKVLSAGFAHFKALHPTALEIQLYLHQIPDAATTSALSAMIRASS